MAATVFMSGLVFIKYLANTTLSEAWLLEVLKVYFNLYFSVIWWVPQMWVIVNVFSSSATGAMARQLPLEV